MPEGYSPRSTPGRTPLPRRRIIINDFSDGLPSVAPAPRQPLLNDDQREILAARRIVSLPEEQPQPVQPAVVSEPQPITPTPEPEPVPAPNPEPIAAPVEPELPTLAHAPVAPILDFTPPPLVKKRKLPKLSTSRLPKLPKLQLAAVKPHLPRLAIGAAVLLIIAGTGGFLRLQAIHNKPDTVFNDALQAALATQKYTSQTTTGSTQTTVDHDFSNLRQPVIASEATATISGATFGLSGYGSPKNSYISYTSLPAGVSASLSNVIKDGWIQLRTNGQQPVGVSNTLASLADPGYQAFGPVVMGNFSSKLKTQIAGYTKTNNIYKYDVQQVTTSQLNGKKVLVYKVKLNVDSLKTINQSAAVTEGFSPANVQAADNALDSFKNATTTFYVAKGSHRFVQVAVSRPGAPHTTITYSNYNQVSLPNEPVTKLGWAAFSQYQFQMDAQTASQQSAEVRDSERQTKLAAVHAALTNYFADTSSFPTFANLNDQTWIAANLPGLDPDSLRDPQAANLSLVASPKPLVLAYQPTSDVGKACDNTGANLCTHYKLTAILSTNQPAVVQDP